MNYCLNLFGYGSNVDNKFYYLSLMKEEHGWSIHGLWPQYSKTSYPKYCKKVNFSYDKLLPIIDKLNSVWYSNKEPNKEFWKHEWEKHGSCMFLEMDELEYFNKCLDLYKKTIENNRPELLRNKNQCLIPFDLNFNFKN